MEQLEFTNQMFPGILQTIYQKKVEIKFSMMELIAFLIIIKAYLNGVTSNSLLWKSNAYLLLTIYENKIRPKQMSLKNAFKLKFDPAQASCIYTVCYSTTFKEDSYEENLSIRLRSIIHQQLA